MLKSYLLLTAATLFSLNVLFVVLSFVCMSTTLCVNDTVQFTFFLVMRLTLSWWTPLSYRNQSIDLLCKKRVKHYHGHELWVVYCNTCTLYFLSLKLENGVKKHVGHVTEIKYEFVKLVVIILPFTRCDYVIFLILVMKQHQLKWNNDLKYTYK